MKQFRKPPYHIFLRTPLPRYWWRHNLRSPQKLFSQICLNYISLGCSLGTNQFLINHYGLKMHGRRDITSYEKCYDVITGKQGKMFFAEHSHIIYQSKALSLMIIFYWKTMTWKSFRKEIFLFSFALWWKKNLKQWGTETYFFIFICLYNRNLVSLRVVSSSFPE